jgi:signal peptidase I
MLPKPEPEATPKKKPLLAITGFGVVLLFALGFALYCWLTLKTVVVSGQSMLPTLKNGKKVLVSNAYWLVGAIRDGDIVVIKGDTGEDYIIKRVYKMAGEKVDVVNMPNNWQLTRGEFVVPEGTVYVIGDNREVSDDSRRFGPVERTRILGKVVAY